MKVCVCVRVLWHILVPPVHHIGLVDLKRLPVRHQSSAFADAGDDVEMTIGQSILEGINLEMLADERDVRPLTTPMCVLLGCPAGVIPLRIGN